MAGQIRFFPGTAILIVASGCVIIRVRRIGKNLAPRQMRMVKRRAGNMLRAIDEPAKLRCGENERQSDAKHPDGKRQIRRKRLRHGTPIDIAASLRNAKRATQVPALAVLSSRGTEAAILML